MVDGSMVFTDSSLRFTLYSLRPTPYALLPHSLTPLPPVSPSGLGGFEPPPPGFGVQCSHQLELQAPLKLKIPNIKHQITNKFQITSTKLQTISKSQYPNTKPLCFEHWNFGYWDLFEFCYLLSVICYLLFGFLMQCMFSAEWTVFFIAHLIRMILSILRCGVILSLASTTFQIYKYSHKHLSQITH